MSDLADDLYGGDASQDVTPAVPDLNGLEQRYNLPSGLLHSVMHQESGGDPNAVSDAGAQGLFQFMPRTAKQYGIDPLDPQQAADGAARMYADLSKKYNGDVPSMLAAYNWGQGNVDRKGLGSAPKETRDYINNIMGKMESPKTEVRMASYEPMSDVRTEEIPQTQEQDLAAELYGNQSSGNDLATDLYGGEPAYSTDPARTAYQGVMNNVAKPLNNAVNSVVSPVMGAVASAESVPAEYAANALDSSDAGQWIGDKLLETKNAVSNIGGRMSANLKDLESYNPDLEKDLSAFGENAQLAGNLLALKGAGKTIAGVTQPAADSFAASKAANIAAKVLPYDDLATHSAISDSYGAAKEAVKPYYNLMQTIGAGETANAGKLKPALDAMIDDIQNTPFHEATSELSYLKQQAAKVGEDGTLPLNDMVKLKQNLNSNFNPKRFAQGADSPYAKVGSLVDDSLADAGKRIPEFADAKSLADKQWLNTVKSPFEDNTVLQKFWKPEDYYAKKSVENGMLEDLPDPTKQRASSMVAGVKTPVQLNAIRRVLPQDIADSLSQAKIQHITQGEGVGRLGSAGKAIAGALDLRPSGIANTGRNLMNVINPRYKPGELELINAAKTPSPTLSTKYAKPFQQLKAQVQQMKDSAGEMRPVDYAQPAPPEKPLLALPAPQPYTVNARGAVSTGGPYERGVIERNTGASEPPLAPEPPVFPPKSPLALPAPKPYTVNSRGAVSTGMPREGIIERNTGATPPPLSDWPKQTLLPPASAAEVAPKAIPNNALVPHMEGVVSELENSSSGHRYFDFSPEGQGGSPNVVGVKSDSPSWFQNYNKNNPPISKKYVRDTFEKMKTGAALGERQQKVADIIRREGIGRYEENEAQRLSAVDAAKNNLDDPSHEAAVMHDNVPFAKGGLVNTSPTEAQKEAGNYKKHHIRLHGMDIAIENPKGSVRSGKNKDGKEWRTVLPAHYGYFKGTTGKDGDAVDVYIGEKPHVGRVYMVHQVHDHNGKFDEHKAMLGFSNKSEALDHFKRAFSDGKGSMRIGSVVPMSVQELKHWLKNGDTKKRVA